MMAVPGAGKIIAGTYAIASAIWAFARWAGFGD